MGSLAAHWEAWKEIGIGVKVLQWIRDGYPIRPMKSLPYFLTRRPHNRIMEGEEEEWFERELARLIAKRAIEQVGEGVRPPSELKAISYVRLAPKKGPKKFRLVVNLRPLNRFLPIRPCRYEGLHTLLHYARPGWWMVSWDLKEGYFHVSIEPRSQSFLGIFWKNRWFQYRVLPFGLSHSPAVFSAVVTSLAKYWRQQGIRVVVYLDDFCIVAPTREEVIQHREFCEDSMIRLGLIREPTKGQWEPTQMLEFLGLLVDTAGNLIRIPLEKKRRYAADIENTCSKTKVTIRDIASIAGKIVSLARALPPARLYTRELFHFVKAGLQVGSKWDYDADVEVTPDLVEQLQWISGAMWAFDGMMAWRPTTLQIVKTDASKVGWGVQSRDRHFGAPWSEEERLLHINELEMKAVFNGLTYLGKEIADLRIALHVDNTTVHSYLTNFKGGSQPRLNALAKGIWMWTIANSVEISEVMWIPTDTMGMPDFESRWEDHEDWQVRRWVFAKAQSQWGPHTIDRFASHRNHLLPRFNSRVWCPNTEAINAFTQRWSGENNWCVPPVHLIAKVLRLVLEQGAVTTILVPVWEGQPWFQQLRSIEVGRILLPMAPSFLEPNPRGGVPFSNLRWRWMLVRLDGSSGSVLS